MPGILAADLSLNPIEGGDTRQSLGRDRRHPGLGLVVKAPAHMAPAENQGHPGLAPLGMRKFLVGRVSVALQDAPIGPQQPVIVLLSSTRGVAVDHGRRVGAVPGPIITRDRPEVARLGPAPAGIEHRHRRLVGKQPRRGQQDLAQPGHHRRDLGRGIADPKRQRGAIQIDTIAKRSHGVMSAKLTGAGHHLRLAV